MGQRRNALVTAALAFVAFVLVAPFAQIQLAAMWAFLPIYESAFITLSLIIVSLLLFQYRMVRTWGLLLLAGGFMFSAAMACVHALSFPGLFAPNGVLGGGPQSTAWIYFLWHGGFALFVVGYALRRDHPCRGSPLATSVLMIVCIMALITALALLTTAGHDLMPGIMAGNRDAPAKLVVALVTWMMSILALGLLWRGRPHTNLDLWLMVLLCIWTFDSALSAVLNHARFDLGWYVGRVFGLVAESLALVVLLMENNTLYIHLALMRVRENRRSARRLEEGEKQVEATFEQAAMGIALVAPDGRWLRVNKKLCEIVGYDVDEMMRISFQDITYPADLDADLDGVRRMLAGEIKSYTIEKRYIHKLGHTVWINLSVALVEKPGGGPDYFVSVVEDITRRKAIEDELERYRKGLEQLVAERTAELESAEARLRLILESTADGIYGVDIDGRITFVNPGVGAILGWQPEQLIGRTSLEMLHHTYPDGRPFPPEACPLLETLRAGIVHRFDDEYFWAANGQPIPVSFSTHPMVRDGRIVGAVVSFNDISVRKAADAAREAALAAAKRLASLRREFLANMSHEIRTPLSAIVGLAQIGKRDCPELGWRETFSRILNACHGLQQVVDDILDFSKIESGKMAIETIPMDLGAVVDRAIDMLALRAREKGLRLDVHEQPDNPLRCLGDANRLCQVLINLLSNAIKFTRAGGTVTLGVACTPTQLSLSVSDTGIGIAPEAAESLFQPFQQADGSTTRRFGGTGLGLSISRNLVELMGGALTFDSVLGRGSTFTVTLPLAGIEPAPPWPLTEVALLGLDAVETDQARRVLPCCHPIATHVPVPEEEEAILLLIDRAMLDDPAQAGAVRARLERGKRVAVLVQPGDPETVAKILPGLAVLERPFRPRHLRRLLAEPLLWPDAADAAVAVCRLSGLRVLGAEDNKVNRLVLDDILQTEGATLTCFENGRLALDHLRQHGAASYDLVLTDVQMPELDGYGLAEEISRFAPGLPVIGLTAHAMEEERLRCLASGMIDRVIKPISPEALVAVIHRHALIPKNEG